MSKMQKVLEIVQTRIAMLEQEIAGLQEQLRGEEDEKRRSKLLTQIEKREKKIEGLIKKIKKVETAIKRFKQAGKFGKFFIKFVHFLPYILMAYIGIIAIIGVFFVVQILFAAMAGILYNSKTETSLTYYEGENFYGLPYNEAFKGGDYNSIFTTNPEILLSDIPAQVEKVNKLIEETAKKIKVKDIQQQVGNEISCGIPCENDLSLWDMFDIKLVIQKEYMFKDYVIRDLVNTSIGKSHVHYVALKAKARGGGNKDFNVYLYKNADTGDIENSLIKYEDDSKNILGYSLLLAQPKSIRMVTNQGRTDYEYLPKPIYGIMDYLDNYFFTKHNFAQTWRDTHRRNEYNYMYIHGMEQMFKKHTKVGDETRKLLRLVVERDYNSFHDSNMVDMLNYSGITSPEDRETSQSNQYLLAQEKIDLAFFQKRNFGKDYKHMIFYPNDLPEIKYEDIEKILNYKEGREGDADSNEFGFYIENEIANGGEVTPATNSVPIFKDGGKFYSEDAKVPPERAECSFIYPVGGIESDRRLIPYNMESLYAGSRIAMDCPGKKKNYTWRSETKPLLQKASIVYYKRFVYDDENPASIRPREEYFLNYFYDKSYIQNGSSLYAAINLINNIYLDRNTLLFRGIYMRISGFGIEIKDDGRLIVAKKDAKGYEAILPEAPIKIEMGILTELNKEEPEVQKFEEYNNPYNGRKFEFKRGSMQSKAGWHDMETKLHYYDEVYDLDKENSFLAMMDKSPNKFNTQKYSNQKIEGLEYIRWGKRVNENNDSSAIQDIMDNVIGQEITKFKDNYFYDAAKRQKFTTILDAIYDIRDDRLSNVDIFKKYLIIYSDFGYCREKEDEDDPDCLIDRLNNQSGKTVFNRSTERSQSFIQNTFDTCGMYKDIFYIYSQGMGAGYFQSNLFSQKQGEHSVFNIPSAIIRRNLLGPCHNSYFPFAKFTPSTQQKIFDSEATKIFGYKEKSGSPTDPELYQRFPPSIYDLNPDTPKAKQVELMFKHIELEKRQREAQEQMDAGVGSTFVDAVGTVINGDKDLGMEDLYGHRDNRYYMADTVAENAYKAFYSPDAGDDTSSVLWEAYKRLPQYKNNCTPEEVKITDSDFICTKEALYEDFFKRIQEKPEYFHFVKEEYLKEAIQDEPFQSYYNGDSLEECERYGFCVKYRHEMYVGSNQFVPVEYYKYKYRNPYFQNSYNEGITVSGEDADIYNNNVFTKHSYITDFSYSLDLNKSFSFKPKNYSPVLDLHTVSLNPNLYMYSFIQGMKKKKEKYILNFFGTGFESLWRDMNKKDIEIEYIERINSYFQDTNLFNLTNDTYKTLDFLGNNQYQKSVHEDYMRTYDIVSANYELNKYIGNTTIRQNLRDYIQNRNINSMSPLLDKALNNTTVSPNFVKIPTDYVWSLYNTEYRRNIFNKFLHTIYLGHVFREKQEDFFKKYQTRQSIADTLAKVTVSNKVLEYDTVKQIFYKTEEKYLDALGDLEKEKSEEEILDIKKNILLNGGYLPNEMRVEWLESDGLWSSLIRGWQKLRHFAVGWSGKYIPVDSLMRTYPKTIAEDYITKNPDIVATLTHGNAGFSHSPDNIFNYTFKDIVVGYNEKLRNVRGEAPTFENYMAEQMLLLRIYNGDIIQTAKEYKTSIDASKLQDIIIGQVSFIQALRKNNPKLYDNFYYQYLLTPPGWEDGKKRFATEEEIQETIELYKEDGIYTGYEEYVDYMNIILASVDNMRADFAEHLILPLGNVTASYQYNASESTQYSAIWNSFIKSSTTTYMPVYNFIGDLFLNNNMDNQTLRTFRRPAKLKVQEDIENFKDRLEVLKEMNKGRKFKDNILAIKSLIQMKEELLSMLDDEDYYEYTFYENTLQIDSGRLVRAKLENSYRTDEEMLQGEGGDYNKFIFFTGPMDGYNYRRGFHSSGGNPNTVMEHYQNNFLNLLFGLSNLRTTEKGLKNIVDEFHVFSMDAENEKIESFKNINNLGNFFSFYTNNGYVDAKANPLKFEIKLADGRDIDDPQNIIFDGPNIYDLKGATNKKVLDQRFEQLKLEYCEKLPVDSKKQNCIGYMDYLKTMTLSELNAELEHLTAIMEIGTSYGGGFKAIRYNTHLEKYKGSDKTYYDMLRGYAADNNQYLGQCVWYVFVLKDNGNHGSGWGDGKDYFPKGTAAGYPGDAFNSYSESGDAIFAKVQEGDIISWKKGGKGFRFLPAYGHVGVVKKKIPEGKKIIVAEANNPGIGIVKETVYTADNLGVGGVVHGVKWKY